MVLEGCIKRVTWRKSWAWEWPPPYIHITIKMLILFFNKSTPHWFYYKLAMDWSMVTSIHHGKSSRMKLYCASMKGVDPLFSHHIKAFFYYYYGLVIPRIHLEGHSVGEALAWQVGWRQTLECCASLKLEVVDPLQYSAMWTLVYILMKFTIHQSLDPNEYLIGKAHVT